jgi:very-short-patch-repair endonuclease
MRPARAWQPQITAPLARLATAQHGAVARAQLRRLGISDQAIRTLVARDHLIRVAHGVYAVGHARLSAHGRWMAAALACGEEAVLSHGDALALHDCQRVPTGAVHVTALTAHRVAGVRCHTARDPASLGAIVLAGIPVTSLERAVLDRAPELGPARLRTLLEAVQRRDLFDLRRFERTLAASNGHRGVGRLQAALAELGDRPPALRSKLEARLLELIRTAGLPEPSVNVVIANELVDLRWPDYRVAVELDSWAYHRSRRSFEADRRGGNAVTLGGDTLLRFTDTRIDCDPDAVIAEIVAALRSGGG